MGQIDTEPHIGRPTKLTPDTVGKLLKAFEYDWCVEDACEFAGIHKDSYYTWLKENPAFSDEITTFKRHVANNAVKNISEAISNGDISTSRWYAEKRMKDFIPKQQNDNNNLNTNVDGDKLPDVDRQRIYDLISKRLNDL